MAALPALLLPVLLLVLVVDGSDLPVAIDEGRVDLLQDALAWMSFRENGDLRTVFLPNSLFMGSLMDKYMNSKQYRAFVIAFQQGVLSRMTLNEGEDCDPAYTQKYKDPFKNVVTYHYQKKFTFDVYDNGGGPFCDYQQGLICKAATKKCGCPEDTSMVPIVPGSTEKRCLLQANKICNLIDLAHTNESTTELANNLYHLIFNLEKPLSCQHGTQCRFKPDQKNTPRCYDVNSGPFYPTENDDHWRLGLGEECVLGLFADSGTCDPGDTVRSTLIHRNVCYNFGPSPTTKSATTEQENKVGFCASQYGPYGYSRYFGFIIDFYPFFFPYIHPRTVPLRGQDLKDFYNRFDSVIRRVHMDNVNEVGPGYIIDKTKTDGVACSVANTKKAEDVWKYFASLERDPPPGQDYVAGATKADLYANLLALEDVYSVQGSKCKVYWNYGDSIREYKGPDSYQCVPTGGPPDAAGNDGKCQKPGMTETKPMAEKLRQLIDRSREILKEEVDEDANINYRKDILRKYPEPPCIPNLGPPPESSGRIDLSLEGGYCPDKSVCYEDFSDDSDLYYIDYDYYNFNPCKRKDDSPQPLICHDVSEELGNCEETHLKGKIKEAMKQLDDSAQLKEGDVCNFEFEDAVRGSDVKALRKLNFYHVLTWLERNPLCNRNDNLECTPQGTCEIRRETEKPEISDVTEDYDHEDLDREPRPPRRTGGKLEPPVPYGASETTRRNLSLVLIASFIAIIM